MLCTAVALLVTYTQAAAVGDLNPIIAHYKVLKSVIFTAIHHEDVGPPGKDSADRVYWSPGRFDITPIAFKDEPPSKMPKLVCNDGQVTAFPFVGDLSISPQDPGPNSIGAWEARGGLLLDWLMDGKIWKRMIEPQEGVVLKFAAGPITTWHDQTVREIILTHTSGAYHDEFLIFIDPKENQLVGTQYEVAGKTIWTEFGAQNAKP
jgi:hypothetical protein